jgi:hypothetical protein
VDEVGVDDDLDARERSHLLRQARFYLDDSDGRRRDAVRPPGLLERVR